MTYDKKLKLPAPLAIGPVFFDPKCQERLYPRPVARFITGTATTVALNAPKYRAMRFYRDAVAPKTVAAAPRNRAADFAPTMIVGGAVPTRKQAI